MPRKTVTSGVAVAAGVLALGAGIGAASLAQAEPTPSPGAPSSSPSSSAPADTRSPESDRHRFHGRGPGGRGMLRADLAEQLAEKLGVTEAKVTEALQTIRERTEPAMPERSGAPSASPSAGPDRPDPAERDTAMAKALAGALGLDEAKVQAALDEIRSAQQAERASALTDRLDAAVEDGTLTRAEADAVTKAVEKGVLGGGPR